MNWSGMIPKDETFSKDTMRGKFPNPTKNIFNSFTFGKNPKVDPNSEGVVNPLFFFLFVYMRFKKRMTRRHKSSYVEFILVQKEMDFDDD